MSTVRRHQPRYTQPLDANLWLCVAGCQACIHVRRCVRRCVCVCVCCCCAAACATPPTSAGRYLSCIAASRTRACSRCDLAFCLLVHKREPAAAVGSCLGDRSLTPDETYADNSPRQFYPPAWSLRCWLRTRTHDERIRAAYFVRDGEASVRRSSAGSRTQLRSS